MYSFKAVRANRDARAAGRLEANARHQRDQADRLWQIGRIRNHTSGKNVVAEGCFIGRQGTEPEIINGGWLADQGFAAGRKVIEGRHEGCLEIRVSESENAAEIVFTLGNRTLVTL